MKITKQFYMVAAIAWVIFLSVGILFAGRIPDTGQTKCYDDQGNEINPCPSKGKSFYGQDANYSINPQSYTKLDEQGNVLADSATQWAMVRDNVTSLIWENKTNDGSIHDKANTYTWEQAKTLLVDELNNEKFGGYSDWRLPNIKELSFLAKRDNYNPSINKDFFQVTVSDIYWSSTEAPYETNSYVRYVHFFDGNVYNYYRTYPYYARCVRGEQNWVSDTLINNGDGTVTNASTSLTWQRETSGYMNWKDALAYCEKLSLAGNSDWRLPNINELESLADYYKYNPVISEYYFPDTQPEPYWSSTTNASSSGNAWSLFFNDGTVYYKNKIDNYVVRCVSGGHISVSRKLGCYIAGTKLTVSLMVTPSLSTRNYAVEDTPPSGWTVSNISDNGTFDSVSKKVRFGPFFDNTERMLTYDLTPPVNTTGDKSFTGVASADGVSVSILGDSVIKLCSNYHPADISPSDFSVSVGEVTAYGAAWKKGTSWNVLPNPIPIDYATRAGALWKGGEKYIYDTNAGACPLCWINLAARSAKMRRVSDSSAISDMPANYVPGETFGISIAVTPSSDVMNYAVEDTVPSGWAISEISDSGFFDTANNKVKYGQFFDNQTRTLTYQITPPANATGTYLFDGTASFDGANVGITGDRSIGGGGTTAAIPGDANQDGKLDMRDVIYILQILTGKRP